MKEIKITSQKEWDELPSKFDECTRINIYVSHLVIKSTPLNSSVVLWDNSSVVLRGNSRAVLYEKSVCYKISNDSKLVSYDNATIYDNNNNENITKEGTVNYINKSNFITPTFEQWLERGWVVVDGISRKLIDKKTINNVTICKTENLIKETSYVVQKGDKFAHGETIEKAKEDLKYKISNRDKSEYKNWKLDDIKPLEEMIESYRVITGACEFGVKDFCNSREMKGEYSVKEVIEITKDSYGNKEFMEFFK